MFCTNISKYKILDMFEISTPV